MLIDFFNKFVYQLESLKGGYVNRILSGSFDSLDDYKFVAGKLNGIEEARELFKIVYKDFFELGSVKVKLGEDEDGDS